MITIAEVIEQCAAAVENLSRDLATQCVEPVYPGDAYAEVLRALAAQYEGCIVAEGSAAVMLFRDEDGVNQIIGADSHPFIVEMLEAKPVYRAQEPK